MLRTDSDRRGVLMISVELEPSAVELGIAQGRRLEAVTDELVGLFAGHHIPATWAVADPVHSAATERILALGPEHEVAILGDPTWMGTQAGRRRFSQELSRRVLGARSAGVPVSTLVPCEVLSGEHLDLVIKHQITAVRGSLAASTAGRPKPLHFGLWEMPTSLSLPGAARWIPGGGGGLAARAGIDRSAGRGGWFHVVVSAPHFGSRRQSAMRTLERVLRHAERRRKSEQIEILTLAQTAARLSQTPKAEPSRSILRASA